MDHMSFLKYMYRVRFSFTDGTEILYRCSMIKPKAKNRWKIACEDGTWVGTGLPCGKLYYWKVRRCRKKIKCCENWGDDRVLEGISLCWHCLFKHYWLPIRVWWCVVEMEVEIRLCACVCVCVSRRRSWHCLEVGAAAGYTSMTWEVYWSLVL